MSLSKGMCRQKKAFLVVLEFLARLILLGSAGASAFVLAKYPPMSVTGLERIFLFAFFVVTVIVAAFELVKPWDTLLVLLGRWKDKTYPAYPDYM